MDYLFVPSSKADLSDIEKDVATANVRLLRSCVGKVMDRFESSPNFRILSYENEWINHPDEFFVEPGVFYALFKKYFGNIYLQHFLTEYNFGVTNFNKVKEFRERCHELYKQLCFDEVECALNKLIILSACLSNM